MKREEMLQWWREAKLGLFIHWGIYSLMGKGEWVMYSERIPAGEYEKLAGQFNPVDFNAGEWVDFAVRNGMKYIVITAKHHDGFSMFKTEVSPYNIVDATPFGRDPMKELAQACREAGIKLGFYYSHVREWRHPLANSFEKRGRGDLYGNYGNFWDYPNENKKDLQAYIDEFDMPQLKELLTQYGDILTIWFDTPSQITPGQGQQIRQLVYELQEGCLVNSRLSEDIQVDYLTMPDNGIPACGLEDAWESPMTTHNGWGYVENAVYQPYEVTIRKIAEIVGKGGNALINIGPDAKGRITEGAQKEFEKIGSWLRDNGEAVYGTCAAGLPYLPQWGYVTKKEDKLYLLVTDPKVKEVSLTGLENRVIKCTALSDGTVLQFEQSNGDLRIDISALVDEIRVIKLDCSGEVSVMKGLYPGEDGSVELASSLAEVYREYPYSKLEVKYGVTEQWFDTQDYLSWKFTVPEDAEYKILILMDEEGFWKLEDFGHRLKVATEDKEYSCVVTEEAPICRGSRRVLAGETELGAGVHRLTLKAEHIAMEQLVGLRIRGVRLERI